MKNLSFKVIIASSLFLSLPIGLFAQDCNTFYVFKENAGYTIQNFDAKDKMTMSVKSKITSVTQSTTTTTANVESENFDAKGKSIAKNSYILKCEAGVVKLNMLTNMVGTESTAQNPSAVTSIEGETLDLPSSITVGQALNNAIYRVKVTMNGSMVLMNKEFVVKDRKVEALESVTTPAGTFEAYKISYTTDFEGLLGKKRSLKSITWFAKGVGMIKTESYDESNKRVGYSLLSELVK